MTQSISSAPQPLQPEQVRQRQDACLKACNALERRLGRVEAMVKKVVGTVAGTAGAVQVDRDTAKAAKAAVKAEKATKAAAKAASKTSDASSVSSSSSSTSSSSSSSSTTSSAQTSASDSSSSSSSALLPLAAPWGKTAEFPAALSTREAAPELVAEHMLALAKRVGFTDPEFPIVPTTYYDWTLEERRDVLKASHVDQLCKSIIMENIRGDASNPDEPRYIMVIVQYTAKLHKEKLARAAFMLLQGRVLKKNMNWRLADAEVGAQLSGFGHNATTPLGMHAPLPMLLSSRILETTGGERDRETAFFLGGGHVDVKWRCKIREFIQVFQPLVADVTA